MGAGPAWRREDQQSDDGRCENRIQRRLPERRTEKLELSYPRFGRACTLPRRSHRSTAAPQPTKVGPAQQPRQNIFAALSAPQPSNALLSTRLPLLSCRHHGCRHPHALQAARGQPGPAPEQAGCVAVPVPRSCVYSLSRSAPRCLHCCRDVLTATSRAGHRAGADQAKLLPRPPPHRRHRLVPGHNTAGERSLLQELHQAQLGRRGWQLQAAAGRGRRHQAGADRPDGLCPVQPAGPAR